MYPIKTDRHFILNMSTILDRCNNYTLPTTIFIYAIMAQYIPNISMIIVIDFHCLQYSKKYTIKSMLMTKLSL